MWWILNTPPRSTHHSAVGLLSAEIVHWFPSASSLKYFPSTALSDPQAGKLYGNICHVDLLRAKFSGKKTFKIHVQPTILCKNF